MSASSCWHEDADIGSYWKQLTLPTKVMVRAYTVETGVVVIAVAALHEIYLSLYTMGRG